MTKEEKNGGLLEQYSCAKYITKEYIDSIVDDCMFEEWGVDDESGQLYVVCKGPDYQLYQFFYQEDVDKYIK